MKKLLSTREVAQFLDVNEKMIYSLISDKGLPATKITGKWLFPLRLVEQWIDANTSNYPQPRTTLPAYDGLLIITGSNDPLLDKAISIFNSNSPEHISVFANLGSMGGLQALRRNLCHMASSHLMQDNGEGYNFDFADREFDNMPAMVNFCKREQGLLVAKGNPKKIYDIADLARPGLKIVNRSNTTGTRLLLDRELEKAGIKGNDIAGYHHEVAKHIDIGLEILSGHADAGPAIRYVAALLDLDFIPLRWERYDLLIDKNRFFDQGVQLFIGMLHENDFTEAASAFAGYDLSMAGKMVFPDLNNNTPENKE
jgi:excisionase family DNA binding protein